MGNFCGWLGSHEIFSLMKINAYSDMVLCESMMMGVATNFVAAWPTLSTIASNSSHRIQLIASLTPIFFYLMLFVQVCRYGLVTKIRRSWARVSITSSLVQQCHAPGLVAVTKFKTIKINFEGLFGLSTIITHHIMVCMHCVKYSLPH